MDTATLVSIGGYGGWLSVILGILYKVLTSSSCIKAKCVNDSHGVPHLEISLNQTQRDISQAHPDIHEQIKSIERIMAERYLAIPVDTQSDLHKQQARIDDRKRRDSV